MNVKRKKSGFTPLEIKVSNQGSNRRSKRFLTGFTIVELLTTLAIIAMLVGLLVPALNLVRNIAKETKQKAQLTTIGLALMTFKNDSDYGDYPPSDWPDMTLPPPLRFEYCGAQKLAEALLGWDLLGFHPKTAWRANGLDATDGPMTYDPARVRGDDSLNERRGPYLELATANAFRLGISGPANRDGLFDDPAPLAPHTFVICDVFGVKKITLIQPGPAGKTDVFKAGTPILYYKANTSSKVFAPPPRVDQRIYDAYDNDPLVQLGQMMDITKVHKLGTDIENLYRPDFEGSIVDPKITARPWPYRPDSYILISAGLDGEYGTKDDIRNFGN